MRSATWRRQKNRLFVWFCVATAFVSVVVLFVLLGAIVQQGVGKLGWDFLTSPPRPEPDQAGVSPALWGTVVVCFVCAMATLPIGVATAIFLQEYQPKNRYMRTFHHFIQLNISNLAGVPSVVYGIIGLTVFANMFGLFGHPKKPAWEFRSELLLPIHRTLDRRGRVIDPRGNINGSPPPELKEGMTVETARGGTVNLHVIGPDEPLPADPDVRKRTLRSNAEGGPISEKSWYYLRLPFDRSALAAGLTLMLVVLPVLIISSQEALTAVPDSLRDGAFGLGATRWQTIRLVTLPAAIPGIMTGSIIAMNRAIGEAAPILMIAGIVYISSHPEI